MRAMRPWNPRHYRSPMPDDRAVPWLLILGTGILLSPIPRRRPARLTGAELALADRVRAVLIREAEAGRVPDTAILWVYPSDPGHVVRADVTRDWLHQRVARYFAMAA